MATISVFVCLSLFFEKNWDSFRNWGKSGDTITITIDLSKSEKKMMAIFNHRTEIKLCPFKSFNNDINWNSALSIFGSANFMLDYPRFFIELIDFSVYH